LKIIDIIMGVMVAVVWGGGFLFAKVAIEHFPPILLMAMRFTVTALVLVWFVPIPKQQLGRLFWIALIGAAIQYSLTFTGLKHINASTAIIIVQLEVPFVVLMAVIFLKDRVELIKIFGIALAFIGVVIIAGEPRLQDNLLPVLMVAGGALTWAIGQVMIKSLGPVGGFALIAWIAVFAAPQLYVSSWLVEDGQSEAVRTAGWLVWAVVAYLGVIMTAVGYAIWYHLLGKHPVHQVAPFVLLLPVVTVLGGVLLLDEELTLRLIVGGVLAIGGVAVVNLIRRNPATT
jgi:O-acetylserine/cysteine efflux transporter